MKNEICESISSDLNISKFDNESETQFYNRLLYSGLVSWMKAVAQDAPAGVIKPQGVSRRYLYDKMKIILDSFMRLFPECEKYFFPDNDCAPIDILRKRLLKQQELINVDFLTNVVLTKECEYMVSPKLRCIKGKILDKNIFYSGLCTLAPASDAGFRFDEISVVDWYKSFVKEVKYCDELFDDKDCEFFDPYIKCHINQQCWKCDCNNNLNHVLIKRKMEYGNMYYLLDRQKMLIYELDKFLYSQGIHYRIMYAQRSLVNNKEFVTIRRYSDHVYLRLFSYLPIRENNILENYAWPMRNISDKFSWVMLNSVWEIVKQYILMMGLDIKEEKYE